MLGPQGLSARSLARFAVAQSGQLPGVLVVADELVRSPGPPVVEEDSPGVTGPCNWTGTSLIVLNPRTGRKCNKMSPGHLLSSPDLIHIQIFSFFFNLETMTFPSVLFADLLQVKSLI